MTIGMVQRRSNPGTGQGTIGRSGPDSGWSPWGVRAFAGLLIALQLFQGVDDPSSIAGGPFTQSYYLITYNHGFVRRGLLGEIVRLIAGVPTRSEVNAFAVSVAISTICAVVFLIELLIRRATPSSCSMAILLSASPFIIDFVVVDRRPDLLASTLLVALGVVFLRTNRVLPWLAIMGLAFAAMVLVHEDVALIQMPWAVVLVVVATLVRKHNHSGRPVSPLQTLSVRLGVLLFAPVAATTAILVRGLPGTDQVMELKSDVASFHLRGGSMFLYLPDSLRRSTGLVESIPFNTKAHTILLGAVLLTFQILWVVRWVGRPLAAPFTSQGHRALGAVMVALVMVTSIALFATGIDWLRWFAECGTSWLIVQSFAVLFDAPGHDLRRTEDGFANGPIDECRPVRDRFPEGRISLPHWMPPFAVYLAAIPPLDVLTTSGQLHHFLFFV